MSVLKSEQKKKNVNKSLYRKEKISGAMIRYLVTKNPVIQTRITGRISYLCKNFKETDHEPDTRRYRTVAKGSNTYMYLPFKD